MKVQRTIPVLIFVVSVLAAGLQTHAQVGKQTKAFLADSFGLLPNGDFKGRADVFMHEVKQYPGRRALIVLYGSPRQIEARKRLIQDHFSYRKFPMGHLETKVGGNVSEFRTEFWIIPARAAPPEIKPEAWIAGEIGRAYKRQVDNAYDTFFMELKRQPDNYVSYIINYGAPDQIALRERWFREALTRNFGYHHPRMTFVNGGTGPVRTVMWLVPPGVESPKP